MDEGFGDVESSDIRKRTADRCIGVHGREHQLHLALAAILRYRGLFDVPKSQGLLMPGAINDGGMTVG